MEHPKLIYQAELLSTIQGEISKQDIQDIYLAPIMKKLSNDIANRLIDIKLLKPHYYRLKMEVHAQEIDNDNNKDK